MDKNKWLRKLLSTQEQYNFPDGYKLLYCPWRTIQSAEIAFISLNPMEPVIGEGFKVISDERGNSYEVEKYTTKSPLTHQFLLLCEFLSTSPDAVLTGTICPFRSARWGDNKFLDGSAFTNELKKVGLAVGEEFWVEALRDVKLIIVISKVTENSITKILNASLDTETDSGWGNYSLRRYKNTRDQSIVALPHLSTFKLFSRPKCEEYLEAIFEI